MICLKISTFVVSTTTCSCWWSYGLWLWFAWKYLPLWYQQQRVSVSELVADGCDLLENIYLCGINNNFEDTESDDSEVVICLKISTFVVSTTTCAIHVKRTLWLWFAWKYLPLWYQQQPSIKKDNSQARCDLLENIYLCGINNNIFIIHDIQ